MANKTKEWFKNATEEQLKNRLKHRKETNLKRYGSENVFATEAFKEKIQQMWKNKSPEEIAERTRKTQETNLKKYGTKSASQSEEVKKKIKTTNLEKYGVNCVLKNKEIRKRIKQTNIEKYGYAQSSKNEKVKNKIRNNYLSKTKEDKDRIAEKRKQTCSERYGEEYITSVKKIQEKIAKTCFCKYGARTYMISEQGRSEIKQNNLEKYGVEYAIGSAQIQEKIRQTNMERHGYEYPMQDQSRRKEMEIKRKETNLKKYGTEVIIHVPEFKDKSKKTSLEKYGVEYNCLSSNCINANRMVISKTNLRFQEKLNEFSIENNLEFKLNRYSYDLKVDNILIEINPTYTHQSSCKLPYFGGYLPPKPSTYHQEKSQHALENGYFCLHIWDWDDEDKIIEMLKPKSPIYARTLKIKEPSYEETGTFLDQYHLQGSCNGQEVRLGLYRDDELIQIMTFGKPRYNKKYQWELLRLCTKFGYSVVGGAEKLFKYFITTYNPDSIISYCDNSKFKGDVYKRIGMNLKSYGHPSKHWFNLFTFRHITDNLLRQRGYSQLHNDKIHKKGECNEILMLEAGYLEIYDCGQSIYTWNKE